MYTECSHSLHLIILDTDEEWEKEDLQEIEADAIRELKPVLNSQVPKGCIKYIDYIESVTDAVVQADKNGQWNFEGCQRIW